MKYSISDDGIKDQIRKFFAGDEGSYSRIVSMRESSLMLMGTHAVISSNMCSAGSGIYSAATGNQKPSSLLGSPLY
jgi:hypothetical protein